MIGLRHAWEGLRYAVRTQRNLRIHLIMAGCVGITIACFPLAPLEILMLLLVIGLVLVAELGNTAIEAVVDLVSPNYHPLAKIAKDTAASMVMVAAVVALAVGGLLLGSRVPRYASGTFPLSTFAHGSLVLLLVLAPLLIPLGSRGWVLWAPALLGGVVAFLGACVIGHGYGTILGQLAWLGARWGPGSARDVLYRWFVGAMAGSVVALLVWLGSSRGVMV